jgi:hypothetical protein
MANPWMIYRSGAGREDGFRAGWWECNWVAEGQLVRMEAEDANQRKREEEPVER